MRKSLFLQKGKVTYQIFFILVSFSVNGKRYVLDRSHIQTKISVCPFNLESRIDLKYRSNIKANMFVIDVKAEIQTIEI